MKDNRIMKLNQAKSRLGAAIKRFRQATDLIDEFLKEVLPEQEKPDWNTMPPEYHLLYDCRSSIHGMKHQTLRLLYQILHVKRIERQRFCPENETQEAIDVKRNWRVVDESHERPGYICLAIREEESGRLIADMSDYPDDVPGFVERVKEEAAIIANAKELRDTLQKLVDCAEPILVEFERDSKAVSLYNRPAHPDRSRFEFAVDEAEALLKKIAGE